jgi:cytochrome P450
LSRGLTGFPKISRYMSALMDLPPGPKSALLFAAGYSRDPFGHALAMHTKYGETFTMPALLGPTVMTAAPGGVEAILTGDPAIFEVPGAALLAPILGESSLILLSGPRHRTMRKLLAPPFHGAAVRGLADGIAAITERRISAWKTGADFDVQDTLRAIGSDVILRLIFGITDDAEAERTTATLLRAVDTLRPGFMFLPSLRRRFFGLSAWSRFERACTESQALIDTLVAARRIAPPQKEASWPLPSPDGARKGDVLGLVLDARWDDGAPLSPRELWEQLMTMFVAGHETTASSLSWAVQLVLRDAAVHDRLRAELDGGGALAELPYLEAVCLETLRLCPIAPYMARQLKAPLAVGRYEIPAGIGAGISIHGVHQRADVFPEPAVFRPERFLGKTYTPFQFLPFGGGSKRCLGAALATLEMKIVLGTIMKTRQLTLVGDKAVRATVRNTTIGPRGGVRVRLSA